MPELETLGVRIKADIGPYIRELQRAERETKRSTENIRQMFAALARSLQGTTDSLRRSFAGLRQSPEANATDVGQRLDEVTEKSRAQREQLASLVREFPPVTEAAGAYGAATEGLNGTLGESAAALGEQGMRLGTLGEELREASEGSAALSRAAERLGFTFSSAFEDAVIEGERLSDVLQGLLKDLSRIGLRTFVTEPLAGAIVGLAKGNTSGLGDLFRIGGALGSLIGGGGGAPASAAVAAAPANSGFAIFAHGGLVNGPGGPRGDRVPAALSAGEFVVNAAATSANLDLLRAINANNITHFADGGLVAGPRAAATIVTGPAEVTIQVNVPPGTKDPRRFGDSAGQAAADAFALATRANRRLN